jgi:hypothetical protein
VREEERMLTKGRGGKERQRKRRTKDGRRK